ncbi:MAG: hypothetical protein GY809_11530 [Planctomycetes bacterium]|nr:hypothetical protein [Planctomycetota bacterium]
MSDHDIIPPVNMDASDTLQRRNQNKQQSKKKKQRETAHPRTEPKALKDQNTETAPESDHMIDYEA